MLPVNTYPLLYQTASLANILFFAALRNNEINKLTIFAIDFFKKQNKKLYSLF